MANSRTEALSARLLESLQQFRGTATAWVAFSGGADSTALLGALTAIRQALSRPLCAVHVNHGVHAHARSWEQHCAMVCRQLDVPFRILRVSPDGESDAGPEAALRLARYAAFESLLETGELLLTAHHREDQAETVLLHLLRGAGTAGLAGMPISRPLGAGILVRPVLGEDQATLHADLRDRGLPWIDDPSNEDQRLDRNYLRRVVLPGLVSRWPEAARTIARSAAQVREDAGLLNAIGGALLDEQLEDPGVLRVPAGWLSDAPLFRLAVRQWMRHTDCAPPPRRRLEEFCRQVSVARGDAAISLAWSGHLLRFWQDRLWLLDGGPSSCPRSDWDGRTSIDLGPLLGRLELRGRRPAQLPWTLTVHPRTGGERLAAENGQHRPVKELLRRAGVPPWLRTSVPLLTRGTETLAVGDWLLAPELRAFLSSAGLELRWQPINPVLARLRAACHARPVETTA